MAEKFGRDLMIAGDEQNQKSENNQFTVESYLHYQGLKFVDRFDANTYLKLTKALDRFDLVGDVGLDTNLKDVTAKVMVVGFTSDWLYTPSQNKKIAESLQGLGKNASYLEIDHDHGHDSFLLNSHDFLRLIKLFLKGENFEKPVQQESQKLKQSNNRSNVKKEADLKVISDWVKKDEKVLDLGCGRGTLLEHLRETKNVKGLGVDYDSTKAAACISRGVNVYQGDIGNALAMLSGASFDWVVFSRMVEELPEPGQVILDALKIGKRVAVSFVNHGYWKNRLHFSKNGSRITNDVYRENWENSHPLNHFSVKEFESFCNPSDKKKKLFRVGRKVYHHGNWRTECRWIPNLMAGLAIYELVRI
jgi:methionine biosynthesis protein MetW